MSSETPDPIGDAAHVTVGAIGPRTATRVVSMPHILIVDDKSRDGGIWAGALRRAGYRVGIAADADAGWQALDSDAYSLLIASQEADGCTGWDLIQRIRAVPNSLPCLLIWEKTVPAAGDLGRVLLPGAALEKPVTITKVLHAVRELLREAEGFRTGMTTVSSVVLVATDA